VVNEGATPYKTISTVTLTAEEVWSVVDDLVGSVIDWMDEYRAPANLRLTYTPDSSVLEALGELKVKYPRVNWKLKKIVTDDPKTTTPQAKLVGEKCEPVTISSNNISSLVESKLSAITDCPQVRARALALLESVM
jgi:hypothetical protein